MVVPTHRNQKKHKGRRRAVYTVSHRRRLLDEPAEERPFSLDDPLSIRQPGDWLENEYLERETMEERFAGLASMHEGITLPPRGLLDSYEEDDEDEDDFYDLSSDIGNDFDDFYDFE